MDNLKMSKVKTKWCFVPSCGNTSIKCPAKVFIQMPKDENSRSSWMDAIGRKSNDFSKISTLFVCADHFDLENDMENFMQWKFMGGRKIMKKNVVPHKCLEGSRKRGYISIKDDTPTKCSKLEGAEVVHTGYIDNKENISPKCDKRVDLPSTSSACSETYGSRDTKLDKSVTAMPHYRSKYIQASVPLSTRGCSPIMFYSEDIILEVAIEPSTSGINKNENKKQVTVSSSDSTVSTLYSTSKNESEYLPTHSTTDVLDDETLQRECMSKIAIKHTTHLVESYPRRYLGVPKECIYAIRLCEKHTGLDTNSVYLTLQKIRLGQTFAELSDAYGLSESSASRVFAKSITLLSQVISQLIIWPSKEKIRELLPLPFRARYSHVQCIIDCLEIEIQKPTDAVKQALTWSEYKKANTLKYLISSTPDGVINFISGGYGGRTSDAEIVQQCGFLNKLQPNTTVMADRGFKHIENLLLQKQCRLLRPPSVSGEKKLSKKEVLETKRIASLRIHIERVIRRLREYKLLKSHSCINIKLIPYMDHIVTVACGLINLQNPIIK